jgi:S-DNA-T family DNA segregation ATPase FtsK/SpoIIIE
VELAFTLCDGAGAPRELVASWQGPATVGQLLTAAGADDGADNRVWAGARELPLDLPLDRAGLRPGEMVWVGKGPGRRPGARFEATTGLHLKVIGGPDAGTVLALGPGEHVLGRSGACDLRLSDTEVSRRHVSLTVSGGQVSVADLGSRNGTFVDGHRLDEAGHLEPGQVLEAGTSVLELDAGSSPDAVLAPASDGRLEVRRPPRLLPPDTPAAVSWPSEPTQPEGRAFPMLAAVAPLVLGGVLWATTGSTATLLFMLMSPLMMGASVVSERRSGRRRYRRERATYAERRAAAEEELARAREDEGRRRRDDHPDPATVGAIAAGPRGRLWERRREDRDFLEVRLGLAGLPARTRLVADDPLSEEPAPAEPLPNVPCVLSLAATRVTGIAGRWPAARSLARWLVAQVATSSGPSDVRMVLLAGEGPEPPATWAWMRWLPHVAPSQRGAAPSLGTTASTVESRVAELVDLVEQRHRDLETSSGRARARNDWPLLLVVLDPAHELRALSGMDLVLREGPDVGVVALCVEESEARLPAECQAVVVVDDAGRAVLRRSGEEPVADILCDGVDETWADDVGRTIGRLADPEEHGTGGSIPEAVRLVDLLGVGEGDAETVAAGWRRTPRATSVPVGVGTEGAVRIDLRQDGPHGLVAGTTGAGKSELLQTLVASLAVANRPDALAFLLVDYKGGSAFRDCARLVHTTGVVTDLDRHLTERALTSLSAELKRREELLARAAAKDIDDYVAAGEPAGPLPRLVIVIDEFAGLVGELPDFVTGLVGIAQRGRSLGIHLVLATQRPSGVVSPEIRANTNLRVALRVTSTVESSDIIDAPDAVRISSATPGRAYLRTGHSSLTLFQSARVGGTAPAPVHDEAASVTVVEVPWEQAGKALSRNDTDGRGGADSGETDLARLVGMVGGAAEALEIRRPPSPWLAPLPDVLPLASLADARDGNRTGVVAAPFGLLDLPGEQAQRPICFDVETGRHLLVMGSPGTGRTSFLRTLAASLASANDPADLWLYAIDCGGGELRALGELAHVGAVVTRSETERTDRLLARLRAEVARRLELLSARGYADVTEQRAASPAEQRLAYVVVLLDRWEGFLSSFDDVDGGRLTDALLELAREGGAAGIRLVVTGDRSLLMGKLGNVVDQRLCLSMADRSDLTLAGLNLRDLPEVMPPGRAVRPGDAAEVQIALLGAEPTGPAQAAGLAAVAAEVRERTAGRAPSGDAGAPPVGAWRRPFRIDPLPGRINLEDARQLPGWEGQSPLWVAVGVGGDELTALGVDLGVHQPGFTVVGPRRSGRSTALLAMAESLLSRGTPVLALCPRPSPLRALAGRPGVLGVLSGPEPPAEQLVELLNGCEGPLGVLVDDASTLHATVIGDLLDQEVQEGPERGHGLIIAGVAEDLLRPMRGFIAEVRQSRAGLMLCPESHLHGEVLGARLPRSAAFDRPPGRGILIADNRTALVQVPLVSPGGG